MQQKPTSAKRLASARENGRVGGEARADRYDGDVLSEWASRGGQAVLAKYGREYFVQLRKRRTHYPKYSDQSSPVVRPNFRAMANRENGRKGGLARAALYSYEWFREWGRLGGIATWTRYGNRFYRDIRKKRQYYQKHYVSRKTKLRTKRFCERMARKAQGSAMSYLWKSMVEEITSSLARR
jgi:general stress protein YciG